MNKLVREIPNIITLGNAICGSIGIALVSNNRFTEAFYVMCLAGVFDFADGFAARKLNSFTEVGKQIDSLADMVSFVVLPSFALFKILSEFQVINMLLYVPALLVAASTYRLAKFNTLPYKPYFTGLATPANAFFIFAMALSLLKEFPSAFVNSNLGQILIFIIILLHSTLLISKIPMFSIKKISKPILLAFTILLLSGIIAISALSYSGLAISIWLYIVISITFRKAIIETE